MIGIIYVLSATVLYSIQGVLVKILFAGGMDSLSILLIRNIIAMVVFLPFLFCGIKKKKELHAKESMIAGMFGFYISPTAIYIALHSIPAVLERIIFYTYPGFIIIFQALLDKKLPEKPLVIAITTIFVGLFFAIPENSAIQGTAILWSLFSALMMCVYVLINHYKVHDLGSLLFVSLVAMGAAIAAIIHFMISNSSLILPDNLYLWSILLAVTFFSYALPLFLLSEGIRKIGGSEASIICMIGPILTFGFGYMILGEVITKLQILGGIIILSAVIYINFRKKNNDPILGDY